MNNFVVKAFTGGAVIGLGFAWLGSQHGALPALLSLLITEALGGSASALLAVEWTDEAVLAVGIDVGRQQAVRHRVVAILGGALIGLGFAWLGHFGSLWPQQIIIGIFGGMASAALGMALVIDTTRRRK